MHPQFPLAVLAGELRDTSRRLSELNANDNWAANLRTVLSWSYYALSPDAATVLRLVSLAPGSTIGLPATASVTGLPPGRVREVFRELENAYLVAQSTPGRYRMHDLVRLFAIEQAEYDCPEEDRYAALRRLVDFFLHTANAAALLLNPHRRMVPLAPPANNCLPHLLPDRAAALAWLDEEHHCVLAVQHLAASQGWYAHVWQLAWTLNDFHARRGHLHEDVAMWKIGLAAARYLNQPDTFAHVHRHLGRALSQVGMHDDAVYHLHHALRLCELTKDLHGQAGIHHALATSWARRGHYAQALVHAISASKRYRALDNPVREAAELATVGRYEAQLGRYQQAREHCEAALALQRYHSNRWGEASAHDSLGYIAHHTGRHHDALNHYEHALTLVRELGHTFNEAETLDRIGEVHADLGEVANASSIWQQALELYQIQHRAVDADRVRQRLSESFRVTVGDCG